jgi:very-short-patch-repair endonuclease
MVREELEIIGLPYEQEVECDRYSIDFVVPSLQLAIEADGTYWHRKVKARDAKKSVAIERMGLSVYRIESDRVTDQLRLALTQELARRLRAKCSSVPSERCERAPGATTSRSNQTIAI